jgi:(E)-4-hydroxy-3-methylbut-2-enyl-diphosphate synthase
MRLLTKEINIGSIALGGKNPLRLQSMTSTKTLDTKATVEQTIRIFDAGADFVRITAQSLQEAKHLAKIKKELSKHGYNKPLIADVHFNPKVAEEAARIVEKVRINPGNYSDKKTGKFAYSESEYDHEIEKIAEKIFPLLKICKENCTALRIGVNHGSLSERIVSKYGDTVEGMVASAMEFIKICESYNFQNIVLSMKSSNTKVMIYAYRLLAATMIKHDNIYPLHLGVTEAGSGDEGRIKSAAGIGVLLNEGIGDTIRVSLTEEPENEIPVAKKIADYYFDEKQNFTKYLKIADNSFSYKKRESTAFKNIGENNQPVVVSSAPNDDKADYSLNDLKGNIPIFELSQRDEVSSIKYKIRSAGNKPIIINYTDSSENFEDLLIKSSADISCFLADGLVDGISIDNKLFNDKTTELAFNILQANGLRRSKAEYISCPTCGRTSYNVFDTLQKVKEKTSHLKNLKIAVMGCIVNGPGEMADADYGYVGSGNGKVTLYKGNTAVKKNVPEDKALENLIDLIKKNGDWQDFDKILYDNL